MELKSYQKRVIADLEDYLDMLIETKSTAGAYNRFWNEKGFSVGNGGIPAYSNIVPGAPCVCTKVPTGGGKTYIACNAIETVFSKLPESKTKTVVWLVPSEAILTQTLKALKDKHHPYRQAIDRGFGSRVEVFTKSELLAGQNFNIGTITEQLSVMVLSYDSFRGRKEVLKSKQENSALAPLARALGEPDAPIDGADETALIQIINQLNPLVIVDESHHARSELSKEMLIQFNPCMVFELTATPKKDSNIISYVDATALKRSHMIKLPVIVYNRSTIEDVITDAIDLRNKLEEQAQNTSDPDGKRIRPIVLLQAQPRISEDAVSFAKLKSMLVQIGIPEEQIAIKTSETDELKGVDLLSADCQIRYIITVSALKEGWDCPYAYILASLANKTSETDVEQIVGRILRQPYQKHYESNPSLNMSYVLASSSNFQSTLDSVVKGLNGAGYSEKDCRKGTFGEDTSLAETAEDQAPVSEQNSFLTAEVIDNPLREEMAAEKEDFLDFKPEKIKLAVASGGAVTSTSSAAQMIKEAEQVAKEIEKEIDSEEESSPETYVPAEIKHLTPGYKMRPENIESGQSVCIPQFYRKIESCMFINEVTALLQKEQLTEDFTLNGKSYDVNFDTATEEDVAKIDVKGGSDTPQVFKLSAADQRYFKEQFSKLSSETKIKRCKEMIHKSLNRINEVDSSELRRYTDLVIDSLDREHIAELEKNPLRFAECIKRKVEDLLEAHRKEVFRLWIETGEIICQPSYKLPDVINPAKASKKFGKSLYTAEETGNAFEERFSFLFSGADNILWWHRNEAGRGFCLNGFINHYPDFVLLTNSGKIVLVESKGDYLDNKDSKDKVELGRIWQEKAASIGEYRYYMVFENADPHIDGAYSFDKFAQMLKRL